MGYNPDMLVLSDRQKIILKKLIELYFAEGEEVSSFNFLENFDLNISPATLRSEFLELTNKGLLVKTHFASGRLPTHLALKYYIENLMNYSEEEIDFDEVSKSFFTSRNEINILLRKALGFLYKKSKCTAFITYDFTVQFYRISKLVLCVNKVYKNRKSQYIGNVCKFFDLIEDYNVLSNYLAANGTDLSFGIKMLNFEDLGIKYYNHFLCLFSEFKLIGKKGYIGTLGTVDADYRKIVPVVKTLSDILNRV